MTDSQRSPKFFVTHSFKDVAFARQLTDDLRERGLEGFFDVYSIKPGDNIAERISRGLEECDVYVPVLSRAALKSRWCKEEINAAVILSNEPERDGRPRLIPVLVENCQSEMPVFLRSRLFVNFTGRYDVAMKELLEQGLGVKFESEVEQKDSQQLGATEPPQPKGVGCLGLWRQTMIWWSSLGNTAKAKYTTTFIAGVFGLLVACIGLVGTLGQPIIVAWVTRPTATFTPTATMTQTPTKTLTYTPIPTKTLTPTPIPTPFATVKAFSIIKEGKVIDVVSPEGTTNIMVGWNVLIRADVFANTDLINLVFTWYTCRRTHEVVESGRGVLEMPYEAPSGPGGDCVQVEIEKGGDFLSKSYIKVKIEE